MNWYLGLCQYRTLTPQNCTWNETRSGNVMALCMVVSIAMAVCYGRTKEIVTRLSLDSTWACWVSLDVYPGLPTTLIQASLYRQQIML